MPRGAKPGERRGGRAKGTPNKNTLDIQALAQKHGPALVDILVQLAKDEQTPHAARVSAIKEALDRGYGKPSQILGSDPQNPLPTPITTIEHLIVDPKA